MTVSVLVPYTPNCPERATAWRYVRARYETEHLGWEIIEGHSSARGFSRTQAILDAASKATGDVFVVADADVFTDGIAASFDHLAEHGWCVPHRLLHRLSPESSSRVMAGEDWHGLPLSTDNHQDRRPYKGNECGTLVVLTRDNFHAAPPDPRFVGWGSEDVAWSLALRCLVGPPWRGDADLVHLWHPPQDRQSRTVGNRHNDRLLRRYRAVRRSPEAMRALLEEVNPDGRDVQDAARGTPRDPSLA